jgi:hypothetical protein
MEDFVSQIMTTTYAREIESVELIGKLQYRMSSDLSFLCIVVYIPA